MEKRLLSVTLEYASNRSEVWHYYWRAWRQRLWIFNLAFFLAIFTLTLGTVRHELKAADIILAVLLGLLPQLFMALYPQILFKPQVRSLSVDEAQGGAPVSARSQEPNLGQRSSPLNASTAIFSSSAGTSTR
jgi:hypothetical protein